jgi:hypothetical protein
MLRTLACTAIALCLFANAGLCGDEAKKKKKKKGGLSGEIVKVDADKGTLTVKVQVKKQFEEKEFKVTDKTTLTADNALELLKKEAFKAGAKVTVVPDEDGSIAKAITLGTVEKKKKKNKTE